MGKSRIEIEAARAAAATRAGLVEDLRRLMADAGVSIRALAAAAGLPQSYVSRILLGAARPSTETYARLAAALGGSHFARIYPETGPRIRDRHQSRILEALLTEAHPRWRPHPEVLVRSPARGWIDVVLHESRERLLVATEIESDLRRLEQQVRRGREKVDSLPSWSAWPDIVASAGGEPPRISQLLIVRRTRTTRRVAAEFARQLAVAFPAHPDDAVAALVGDARWPGSALVWVDLDTDGVRFIHGR